MFPNYNATAAATKEDVDKLEEPLVKMVQELDMLSSYTAGPSGKVERGPEYINSTVTGYDQAVQTFAEGKAMFIKQGNWYTEPSQAWMQTRHQDSQCSQ